MTSIAARDFFVADPQNFAAFSGDYNPMHMDALAARRTMAGFPVVHGIHTLLWSLDRLFHHLPDLPPLASIKAGFQKMVYVGDHVELVLARRNEKKLNLEVIAEGVPAVTLQINFGEPRPAAEIASGAPRLQPAEPAVLSFEAIADQQGRIPLARPAAEAAGMFPAAARALGAQRVAGLACSSYLVGMVCPGLHSIYAGLELFTTSPDEAGHDEWQFRVASTDGRFRLVKLAVSGCGWTGSVNTHVRPAPAAQAGLSGLAAKIAPDEFAGMSVLVIGGSRGLGELTAKIAAAGGAHVTISYAVGEADAHHVQAEIVAGGGACDVFRYDVLAAPSAQLAQLQRLPDMLFYMATPHIAQRRSELFMKKHLDQFLAYYVTGFYDLCTALRSLSAKDFGVFYPSSIAVEERPASMTEYTMAKAAGEVLCADMLAYAPPGPIVISRLPRLPTDQTATVFDLEIVDPVDVMLPIIRDLHAKHASGGRKS